MPNRIMEELDPEANIEAHALITDLAHAMHDLDDPDDKVYCAILQMDRWELRALATVLNRMAAYCEDDCVQ